MATTRLMPLHIGKGRDISTAIADIIDYVENPQKTDFGKFIYGYECDTRIADAEFLLSKRQYANLTGRNQGADDVIAYHLRQAFKPGEVTPEEDCRHYGLYLFIDGARLGYGLTAPDNDLTLADITNNCDVFCIGGTKCGALFGEAAVIINPALKDDFRTIMKQGGAVLAKGRLLGLQFETLFTDGLYYKICRHGVELALQIKAAVQERGLGFVTDSTTNQQFIIFPQAMYDELSKQFALAPWEYMDDGRIAARICTSWATDPTQVDRLCNMIKAL